MRPLARAFGALQFAAMKRYAPILLAVAVVSAVAPFASAETRPRVGVDQSKGVSFSISRRDVVVTLRPLDGAENPLAAELSGKDVQLACRGKSPSSGKFLIGSVKTTWPKAATALPTRLSKDVSAKVSWCVLEHPDGEDIAVTTKVRVPAPSRSPIS
jgi:hypothetical protein